MAFIIVMVSLVLAGVISTAWLRVFDQPKKKENGTYPPWVVLYYLVVGLGLTIFIGAAMTSGFHTRTNMGILSNPMLYFYTLRDQWAMTMSGGGMFALLASCGLAVLLLTLVLCAVKLIVMRLKKQRAASSIWWSFFISLGLLLFNLGYASFLELSFVLLPVLLCCVILRLIWRRMKKCPCPASCG